AQTTDQCGNKRKTDESAKRYTNHPGQIDHKNEEITKKSVLQQPLHKSSDNRQKEQRRHHADSKATGDREKIDLLFIFKFVRFKLHIYNSLPNHPIPSLFSRRDFLIV